ncbi:MAG: AAA family ATPase [Oligoflexia bacterium]|nr:AAA family ATPase [Oligoflexia bacterium]
MGISISLCKQKLITSILVLMFFTSVTSLAKEEDKELLKAEDGLKSLSQKLREDYSEMDGYLDTLLLAVLTEQHVLSLGGPGGSKTKTAKDVLDVLKGKLFNLQFSPNTKQEKIVGSIKGKEFLESGKLDYETSQSLLTHDYAILDEIDKANTEVLASALSVLLERKGMVGDKEIKGNLKTALITSNMTLHEFLEKFRNTNDGSTGMALLDRILFKVLVVNRLSSAESLFKVMNGCKKEKKECPLLKDLQVHLLKDQISKIKVPEEVMKLSAHLWMRLGQALEKKQNEDQQMCSEDPKSMPYPYTMTNQFTNRGAISSLMDVMRSAKYLELVKGKNSNDKSTLLDPSKVCLSPEDLIFTQSQMIIQGPDKLDPGTPQNPNMCPSGKLLEKIRTQYAHNPRTLKMIEDLQFERKTFASIYLEILKIYQDELVNLGSKALMDKIYSKGSDISTISEKEKKEISLEIALIRKTIEEKRKKEFPNGEEPSGVAEVAREKALQELAELEKMLELSKSVKEDTSKKLQEQAEEEKKKKLAQEDEEKKLKEKIEEHKKKFGDKEVTTLSGHKFYHFSDYPPFVNDGKEAWKDEEGLMWMNSFVQNKTYEQAVQYCLDLNPPNVRASIEKALNEREEILKPMRGKTWDNIRKTKDVRRKKSQELAAKLPPPACRAPNLEEYELFADKMKSKDGEYQEQIFKLKGKWFWSSSLYDSYGAFYFSGDDGDVGAYRRSYGLSARCACSP